MRALPLIILALLGLLSGCAGMPETVLARAVGPGETPVLAREEILVFGRILFTGNGVGMPPYGALTRPLWQLATPEAEGDKPQAIRRVIPFLGARPDSGFAYVIPAGRYQVSHVEPRHYLPHVDPALAFDGATPCRAYYLGDLEVDIETTSWLGGLWGDYITRLDRLDVADRFDPGQGHFTGCDGGPEPVLKALLARMPGRAPELKSNFPASLMGTFSGGLR